jgi:hypothetical protein
MVSILVSVILSAIDRGTEVRARGVPEVIDLQPV